MATVKLTSESKNRIYLIGMMGVGKSTIGRILASELDYKFMDTDELIEKQGITIPEIFANRGEQAFREMEVSEIMNIAGMNQVVVATGGGLPAFENNLAQMLTNGFVIYLKASFDTLLPRLNADGHRPILGVEREQLPEILQTILLERKLCYEMAHITIDADSDDPHAIVDSILKLLVE